MSQLTGYRDLINRGRKAGLNTAEIYSAMAARPAENRDELLGRADCNGYVSGYSQDGRRVYRPLGNYPRP
jgi:hypothetical protein